MASLFNKKGLYSPGDNGWEFNSSDTPGASYSTRISTNAETILAIIPGPAIPLTLSSLTFTDSRTYANLGNVKIILFQANGGNATINADAPGDQSLSKPLILASHTDVSFTAGGTLTISGLLDNSAGSRISVGGGGALAISGPRPTAQARFFRSTTPPLFLTPMPARQSCARWQSMLALAPCCV